MVRALKVISLERGHDPRDFSLVAFGGAGGLHACRLADELDISRVIVPRSPGVLSAYGMLTTEPQRRYSASILQPLSSALEGDELRVQLQQLQDRAEEALGDRGELSYDISVDLRYVGQSFEITVPVEWASRAGSFEDPAERFARRHEALYGYRDDEREVELVALRLQATVPREMPEVRPSSERSGAGAKPAESAMVRFAEDPIEASIIDRRALEEGGEFAGPCVITEYSGTTVVPPHWRGRVEQGHLVLEVDS